MAALELDRRRPLVRGTEGLPARKVCLHSLDKAYYAHYYADIVGRAMKSAYPAPLAWIELYAGPGELYVKDLDQLRPGSPVEAINVRDPFDIYVFCDLDGKCVDALDARVGGSARVHLLQGDANSVDLHDQIVNLVPRNALVVLYCDPAGLDLNFDTLSFFAKRYKHLDLLLNFPVPGIDRALSAGHEAKASRVLNHPAPAELIGPTSGRTNLSVREWFERQLRALDYTDFDTEVIRFHENKSPLYDLMIASRESKAVAFFQEARQRGPGGQYSLGL